MRCMLFIKKIETFRGSLSAVSKPILRRSTKYQIDILFAICAKVASASPASTPGEERRVRRGPTPPRGARAVLQRAQARHGRTSSAIAASLHPFRIRSQISGIEWSF